MEQVKLLSMTAVLSLLTWIVADNMVNETTIVRATFELLPRANSDVLIDVAPEAASQLYTIKLQGPRQFIDVVQKRERTRARLRIGDRAVGPTAITLDNESVKRALTETWSEFDQLTVLAVEPNTIPVDIDRLVSKEFTLTTRRLTLPYASEPQLKRSSINVQIRQSRYDSILKAGQALQMDISADLERQLRSSPPGQSVTIMLSLDPRQFGPDAAFSPDSIEVTATVLAQRTTALIPTVPVKPVVSFTNLDKSLMAQSRDGTLLTVETVSISVTGPTEEVAKLQRGDTRAYGLIQIKESDLQELNVLKAWPTDFVLPPQIELAETPAPIEFKLIEQPQPSLQP